MRTAEVGAQFLIPQSLKKCLLQIIHYSRLSANTVWMQLPYSIILQRDSGRPGDAFVAPPICRPGSEEVRRPFNQVAGERPNDYTGSSVRRFPQWLVFGGERVTVGETGIRSRFLRPGIPRLVEKSNGF